MSVTKETVYRRILNQTFWVRSDLMSVDEVGHTFLYRSYNALARRLNPSLAALAVEIRTEFSELIGRTQAAPAQMLNGEDPVRAFQRLLEKCPDAQEVVFEGYAFSSILEEIELNEQLAAAAGIVGLPAVLSDGAAADNWNRKGYFLEQVQKLYGSTAVPIGQEWAGPSLGELVVFAEERFQAGVEKVIFKTSGTGGFANLIVTKNDRLADKLSKFLLNPMDTSQQWVIAEEWRPWILSPCTSFYSDGSTEPVWMEMCEQVLSPETAGFIGGRSFINLSQTDQWTLVEFIRPVARQVYADGVRGFIGFDVILCPPRAEDALRLPDSGLSVVFIEINARLNGHNQERLFCALLAERENVPSDELVHMRVGTKPIAGVPNRRAAKQHFAGLLAGLASPLTNQPLDQTGVRFVLDVCQGEQVSLYDSVLLVGRKSATTEQVILAAIEKLQQAGALKL